MITTLNNARIKQGDRIDSYTLVLNGRTSLDDGHPLKAQGLLTPDLVIRFVAKPDLSLADNGDGVINVTLTAADADNAPLVILPAATSAIVFGDRTEIEYSYDVQVSGGGVGPYTLDSGNFVLVRDVALTA